MEKPGNLQKPVTAGTLRKDEGCVHPNIHLTERRDTSEGPTGRGNLQKRGVKEYLLLTPLETETR